MGKVFARAWGTWFATYFLPSCVPRDFLEELLLILDHCLVVLVGCTLHVLSPAFNRSQAEVESRSGRNRF